MRRLFRVRKNDDILEFGKYLIFKTREAISTYGYVEYMLKTIRKTQKDKEWYSTIRDLIDVLKDVINILDDMNTKIEDKVKEIRRNEETHKYRISFYLALDYINYAYPDYVIKILEDYLKYNTTTSIDYLNVEEAYKIVDLAIRGVSENKNELDLLLGELLDTFD